MRRGEEGSRKLKNNSFPSVRGDCTIISSLNFLLLHLTPYTPSLAACLRTPPLVVQPEAEFVFDDKFEGQELTVEQWRGEGKEVGGFYAVYISLSSSSSSSSSSLPHPPLTYLELVLSQVALFP